MAVWELDMIQQTNQIHLKASKELCHGRSWLIEVETSHLTQIFILTQGPQGNIVTGIVRKTPNVNLNRFSWVIHDPFGHVLHPACN